MMRTYLFKNFIDFIIHDFRDFCKGVMEKNVGQASGFFGKIGVLNVGLSGCARNAKCKMQNAKSGSGRANKRKT